jgi:adenylate cyclase
LIAARPLTPITMKGISREVVPYAVERLHGAEDLDADIVSVETSGLSLYLDPGAIEAGDVEKVRETLGRALAALDHAQPKPA